MELATDAADLHDVNDGEKAIKGRRDGPTGGGHARRMLPWLLQVQMMTMRPVSRAVQPNHHRHPPRMERHVPRLITLS